jgi:hypothetical protein
MKFKQIAEAAVVRGLSVVPLSPKEKKPFLPNWPHLATKDAAQIEKWSQAYPDANCGAVTVDTWILDVDDWNFFFEAWPFRQLPQSFTVRTGSGGLQFHFKKGDSSAASLAKKFSVGTQNIVLSPEYQKLAKYKLEIDRDAEWKIKTKAKEIDFSYKAAGVRGQITGHGFSTLIFDDLFKNGAEAKSDVIRNNVWENVVSAALNRLTPTGIVIALQARFHQDDIIGKLLATEELI